MQASIPGSESGILVLVGDINVANDVVGTIE